MTTLFWLILAVGSVAPAIELTDHEGKPRRFPDGKQAVLLVYEDQDGGKQNQAEKARLGALNAIPENRAKVDVIGVADLSKWHWWPARKYALDDVRKQAAAKKTIVYIDWKGAAHKAWGVRKATSTLILLDAAGKVRFVSEGQLTPDQWQTLLRLLTDLGVAP